MPPATVAQPMPDVRRSPARSRLHLTRIMHGDPPFVGIVRQLVWTHRLHIGCAWRAIHEDALSRFSASPPASYISSVLSPGKFIPLPSQVPARRWYTWPGLRAIHVVAISRPTARTVSRRQICSQPDADVPRCSCFAVLRLIRHACPSGGEPEGKAEHIVDDVRALAGATERRGRKLDRFDCEWHEGGTDDRERHARAIAATVRSGRRAGRTGRHSSLLCPTPRSGREEPDRFSRRRSSLFRSGVQLLRRQVVRVAETMTPMLITSSQATGSVTPSLARDMPVERRSNEH